MSDDKKKFRVIGIEHTSMTQRAAELEQQLNSLVSDGYRVLQITNESTGTILVGEYDPPQQPQADFGTFLSSILREVPKQQPQRHPFTMALMQRLLDAGSGEEGTGALEKVMAPLTKDAPASLLRDAAKEMQDESDAHARSHGSSDACWVVKRLSDGAKIVAGLADSAAN